MIQNNNATRRQTTEQIRAKFASRLATANRSKGTYAQKVQGMTPDIMNNGLLQTLAVYAKDNEAELIVKDIQEWLYSSNCGFHWGEDKRDKIIDSLLQCSSEKYKRAQVETLAFVLWLKRFSKKEETDEIPIT